MVSNNNTLLTNNIKINLHLEANFLFLFLLQQTIHNPPTMTWLGKVLIITLHKMVHTRQDIANSAADILCSDYVRLWQLPIQLKF